MSRILGLFGALAFFAVLGGTIPLNNAYGLSCAPVNTTESLKYADVVFYGKAVSKEYVSNEHDKKRQDAIVQFSVIESFKGVTGRQVSIISEEWLWGFNFTKGVDYVVFAGKNNDGALRYRECSPTGTLEYVNIDELRNASQQYIAPPLQQLAAGINIDEIKCRESLALVMKLFDGSPACVKPQTKEILIERGWGIGYPDKIMEVQGAEHSVRYSIGENATIVDVIYSKDTASVIIKIESTAADNLTIELPRALLDSGHSFCDEKFRKDLDYIVLIDREETHFKEIVTTPQTRTLSIPIQENAAKIEVIALCLI